MSLIGKMYSVQLPLSTLGFPFAFNHKVLSNGGVDVSQKTLPAPLPEDPELLYRELTASDIAMYIGPDRYGMFLDALTDTGRDGELGDDEVFGDAAYGDDREGDGEGAIYGAEDVDDRWTLLHSAPYNGSPKIKRLLHLKGVDPKHLDGIELEDSPTLLPVSPFEAAVLVALVWDIHVVLAHGAGVGRQGAS